MRDSVPSGSYSSVCNVLCQWKSRSSLLIESTDSMIESTDSMIESTDSMIYIYICIHGQSIWSRVGNAQRANVRPAE